ncbi:hypothetical protein GC105_00585 [Alkalibaculum sp. M08DMB]|uniref:Uncharacterized protein n=1 Tax=Alkalibaculum sporogenes TaxID=2655001 RepID=A0A6A7K4J1_9FIRM|nr:hypothetical protein [Alkalibaculum sporogenes]MPW24291.1 hypothetical protein [Alkalibaculum sporogenes]
MENTFTNDSRKSIATDYLIRQALSDYLSSDLPDFKEMKKTSYIKKIINEKQIHYLLDKLITEIQIHREKNPIDPRFTETESIKEIIVSYLLEFDKKKYFFDKPFLKFFIDKGYINVADEFISRATRDDGHLKPIEIFQAMRNVWIMNSLQIMWGITLGLTSSIYGYSMLYPYTDNFLDNPQIDMIDKKKFNLRLSRALNGENQLSNNAHESRVFALVKEIESQYNRDKYTKVYESILLIQKAQINSLKQDQETKMTVDDILPISFLKGGSSVLADAFLVKGNLSSDEIRFSFEYGVFLQLLDDLQDAIEDKVEGHQTIFSIHNKDESFDENINRLISYIFKVNTPIIGESRTTTLMKEIIISCTLIMIMDAVGRNQSLVSEKLYKKLESYSKVRLSFYKKLELRINELLKPFVLSKSINKIHD